MQTRTLEQLILLIHNMQETVKHPVSYNAPSSKFWSLAISGKNVYSCFITSANSPENFYVRLRLVDDDELSLIRDALDEHFQILDGNKKLKPPKLDPVCDEHMEIGLPVAVFLPEDHCFYRAFVLSKSDGRCECYFIDIGETIVVDCSLINYLPSTLLRIEPLAIKACLANIAPLDGCQYSAKCVDFMTNFGNRHDLYCNIVDYESPSKIDSESPFRYNPSVLTSIKINISISSVSDNAVKIDFADLLVAEGLCRYVNTEGNCKSSSLPFLCGERRIPRGKEQLLYSNIDDWLCPPIPISDDEE